MRGGEEKGKEGKKGVQERGRRYKVEWGFKRGETRYKTGRGRGKAKRN